MNKLISCCQQNGVSKFAAFRCLPAAACSFAHAKDHARSKVYKPPLTSSQVSASETKKITLIIIKKKNRSLRLVPARKYRLIKKKKYFFTVMFSYLLSYVQFTLSTEHIKQKSTQFNSLENVTTFYITAEQKLLYVWHIYQVV